MLVLFRLRQCTDAKKARPVGDGQLVDPQGCIAGAGGQPALYPEAAVTNPPGIPVCDPQLTLF